MQLRILGRVNREIRRNEKREKSHFVYGLGYSFFGYYYTNKKKMIYFSCIGVKCSFFRFRFRFIEISLLFELLFLIFFVVVSVNHKG